MGIRTCGLSESIAIHSRTCTGPQVDILLGSFLTYFSAQDFIIVSAQFIANLSPYHGRARHEVIKTYKNINTCINARDYNCSFARSYSKFQLKIRAHVCIYRLALVLFTCLYV